MNPSTRMFFCKDSLEVLRGLATNSVDLVYLDPPRSLAEASAELDNLVSLLVDDQTDGAYLMFLAERFRQAERVLKPTGSVYLYCSSADKERFDTVMNWAFDKDRSRASIVWYNRGEMDHLLFCGPPDIALDEHWDDLNFEDSEEVAFPTQQPLALLERIVEISTSPDDLVLDPFAGSGTACVAAERLGRRWIAIDNDPRTIEVITSRLSEYEVPLTTLDIQYEFEISP